MLSHSRQITTFALCVLALFFAGPAVASEFTWAQKDSDCHGNLSLMLQEVEKGERIPHLRTTRSAEDLFEVLKNAGRFRELGLTDTEGKILVDAVYKKMGLSTGNGGIKSIKSYERDTNLPRSKALSYRAGTEFEKLNAVLMRWPFDWASQKDKWAEMVDAMSYANVLVYMWVNTVSQREDAKSYLTQHGVSTNHVKWVVEKTDDVWMRDYGPQFVYDHNSAMWGLVDFHYYSFRPNDDDTPLVISNALGVPRVNRQTMNVVYTEGGNINHDGLGCIVYSKRTYNRNPGVSTAVIDQRIMSAFQDHTNIVPQDPTLDWTGHVDVFAKIVNEDTVLVGQYDPDETDYQILEDCATLFESSTNGAGNPWNIVRIHQPDVYYISFIWPVVRTYTNSLIVNNVLLMPSYDIPYDATAQAIYEQLLPGITVFPIDASDIIWSGGAWHCVTMEYPDPTNP